MEFGIHQQVLLSVFVIAAVMGAVANKTNFCTMGAVSDWVNMDDKGRLRAWLLAMAVAMTGVLALEAMANLATTAAVEGHPLRLHAPLIEWTKADIVRRGVALGVDYGLTVSCYQADHEGRACGVCDSCRLRRAGFAAAGVDDPTRYHRTP